MPMLPSACSWCPDIVNGFARSARMRAATRLGIRRAGDVGNADDELVAAQARDRIFVARATR